MSNTKQVQCCLELVSISAGGAFPSRGKCPRYSGEKITFFAWEGQPFTIGRGEGAGIQLEAATVSRLACILEFKGGLVLLTDLSDYGAMINGGKPFPTEQPLHDGDQIEIFPYVFRFHRM